MHSAIDSFFISGGKPRANIVIKFFETSMTKILQGCKLRNEIIWGRREKQW